MFKKLVSNLPFNPSLIHQVAFYAKRMHQEERLRRTGLLLVVLAMGVQLFAAASPTEASNQCSDNDMIRCGFSTHEQANSHCQNNTRNFADALRRYGVTCSNLASAQTQSIHSTDYNGQLYSMGRLPYNKPGEFTIPASEIPGGPFYMRPLHSWDTGAYSTYQALVGHTNAGALFMVLYDCGNLVIVRTNPTPPPNNPATSNLQVFGCSDATRRRNFFGGYAFDQDKASASVGITLFIDNNRVGDYQANVSRPDVNQFFHITGNHGFEITLTGHPAATDGKSHTAYVTAAGIDVNGKPDGNNKKSNVVTFNPCKTMANPNPTPSTPTPNDACLEVAGIQTSTSQCKPCDAAVSQTDVAACLDLSKTAKNVTQKIENANGTTAAAGDSITYTLTVKNIGTKTVDDFVVEEHLGDILEYADVTSKGGGTLDENNILRWSKADIRAGSTITRSFTVKVKNPIPETPRSTSNPGSFDLMMTNVYGKSTVDIKLPGSPAKTAEQINSTLPNTGPGTTLAISVAVVIGASYFFARSRLLAKELDMVREEYAVSGGL